MFPRTLSAIALVAFSLQVKAAPKAEIDIVRFDLEKMNALVRVSDHKHAVKLYVPLVTVFTATRENNQYVLHVGDETIKLGDYNKTSIIDIAHLKNTTLADNVRKTFKPYSDYLMVTLSGTVYSDIDAQGDKDNSVAATGTPGRLLWKNFIASRDHKKPKKNLEGAQRRTDYCWGACEPVDKE